ncbi:MAG: ATP-binding protein [Halapricum sp.]
MSTPDRPPWFSILYELLQSDAGAERVIEFIEDHVPNEGELVDYKSDMYISANSSHHQNRRESEFLEYCSAFSNVLHPSPYRFLFIGFNNDGEFEGIQYRGDRGGDHVMDVDDARLRNVVSDDMYPLPTFELFEFEKDEDRGGALVIHRAEQPPVVVLATKRKGDGSEFIAEGQSFTRDGSRTIVMENADYRELIENRERIIDQKLQEISESMGRVVGISSDQLAGLDLRVAPEEDDAIPVEEFLTTAPPSDIDGKLTSAVKSWGGTADLLSHRPAIYEFYEARDDLHIDEDRKAEFLFRSCLRSYVTGAEWFMRYEDDADDLFDRIIAEDVNDRSIRNLEHVLLVLDKENHLQAIADDSNITYSLSKADEYTGLCGSSLRDRVCEYARDQISFGGSTHNVDDLLDDPGTADDLLDEVVEDLLDEDSSAGRGALRRVELVRLAASLE